MAIQLISIFVVWMVMLFISYYWTEKVVWHIPWLQFNVMECRKCFYTWSHLISTLVIYLLSNWGIYLIGAIILNIMTSIALYIDEKSRIIEEKNQFVNE